MICEAETKAAIPAEAIVDEGFAQSVRLPYGVVQKAVDASIPLRRPARCQPNRDAEKELYAKLAAKSTEILNSLNPKGEKLSSLVQKFPAPQEWYEED